MIEQIDSIDDARLAPYRDLKNRHAVGDERTFIAEGEFLVRRLIESDLQVESILVTPRRLVALRTEFPHATHVYVAPEESISNLVGFHFHRGVIACGIRKPFAGLNEILAGTRSDSTYLICPEISDTENLGGIMRCAAAFGVDALILGPECSDPFLRRCVRVSMGAVFGLPIVRSVDLVQDLALLTREGDVELVASILDSEATPLSRAQRSNRPLAIVLGHEASGLTPTIIQACHQAVTIPMHEGTDSLNVATAAALFLFHFTQSSQ